MRNYGVDGALLTMLNALLLLYMIPFIPWTIYNTVRGWWQWRYQTPESVEHDRAFRDTREEYKKIKICWQWRWFVAHIKPTHTLAERNWWGAEHFDADEQDYRSRAEACLLQFAILATVMLLIYWKYGIPV